MNKKVLFSLGLLAIAGLPGCGGPKPVVITEEPETVYTQDDDDDTPVAVKHARVSGSHPKEVGWQEEDYV